MLVTVKHRLIFAESCGILGGTEVSLDKCKVDCHDNPSGYGWEECTACINDKAYCCSVYPIHILCR